MKIKTPKERAYYLASKNEKDRLLCWIPAEEYERTVQEGYIPQHILDDYPDGLEIEVSGPGFDEFQLNVGVSPEAIRGAYADLLKRGLLAKSGAVAGARLEGIAREAEQSGARGITDWLAKATAELISQELPEPAMTDGEDAMIVMREFE